MDVDSQGEPQHQSDACKLAWNEHLPHGNVLGVYTEPRNTVPCCAARFTRYIGAIAGVRLGIIIQFSRFKEMPCIANCANLPFAIAPFARKCSRNFIS